MKNNDIREFARKMEGKKLTILGHENIDVDAFLSGVLLSRLFDFLKIDNEFIVLEEVAEGNETYDIVKKLFNIDMKDWERTGEDAERLLFLEDHFETVHAGKVVGCIDHHPTSKNVSFDYEKRRNSSASSFLIYELMLEVRYPVTTEDIEMIIFSMMIDTTDFKSIKAIQSEVEVAEKLATKYKLDYEELIKVALCLTPIDKMSIEKITSNGEKSYNYNGNAVKSAYLQLYGMPSKQKIEEWKGFLAKRVKKEGLKMFVFIIFETKGNFTIEYQIMTPHLCKMKIYDGILSRGKDIMPKIEKIFDKQ